ncbi:MAG TPA: tetratricopeptide repeat protein, partial [Williamwhitmania sp.]|nr:tetratricopeptide repeat protein [Williamwhitmania sp.]
MKRISPPSFITALTILMLCLSLNVTAQKSTSDSLLTLFGRITDVNSTFSQKEAAILVETTTIKLTHPTPSEQASTLLHLVRAIAEARLELNQEATDDYITAIKQSKKIGHKVYQVIALMQYGVFLQKQGEGEKAMSKLGDALTVARSAGNDTLKADVLLQIGGEYWSEANFTKAMVAFSQATAIGNTQNNHNIIIRGLANQALCSRDLGQLNNALTSIEQAIAEARQHAPQWLPTTLNLKGSIYFRFGQQDSAITAYRMGLTTIPTEAGQPDIKAVLFENLALCFKEKQQGNMAQRLLDSALSIREKNFDTLGLAKTYTLRGNIFLQRTEYADALESYLSALELRQQMKNKAEIASSLTSIGLLYRNLGLNGKALNYFSQALEE